MVFRQACAWGYGGISKGAFYVGVYVFAALPCPHQVWEHCDHMVVLVQGPPDAAFLFLKSWFPGVFN